MSTTDDRTKRWLWMGTAFWVAISIIAVAWSRSDVEAMASGTQPRQLNQETRPRIQTPPIDLDQFQSLWGRRFQGKQYEAATAPKPQKPTSKRPATPPAAKIVRPVPRILGLRLLGTAVESEHDIAIFMSEQEGLLFLRTGEAIPSVTPAIVVRSIDSRRVRMQSQDQWIETPVGSSVRIPPRRSPLATPTSPPQPLRNSDAASELPNTAPASPPVGDPIQADNIDDLSLEDELDWLNGQ
ncbi:hypothetical protein [Crateriforma conspicua]|uniref:hypothetical protein n=1 Tax=Crateriforma conspicua TaxID=2527996 RepID=UPI001187B948|nr:hypothetical protein [Crateriforma conspicua]QDV61730.1 hypothetical protein Mal65_08570 [Crateriforma conspicua]